MQSTQTPEEQWTPEQCEQMKERVLELSDQLTINLPPAAAIGLRMYLPQLRHIDDAMIVQGLNKAQAIIDHIKYGTPLEDDVT